jgi:EPTP domain
MTLLTEWCRIQTSGARAVEPFELDGHSVLAVPQLAYDLPNTDAGMNGGDSDTDLLLLRRTADGYEPWLTVPAPGGEDAEFFRIGGRAFLATASIRSGAGPYRYATESTLYEWNGTEFEPFQRFRTFAAKQWRHFTIGRRHFLALAQGVALPSTIDDNQPSRVYEWSGERFEPFQDIASQWAYNWHAFEVDGTHFLAHADHVATSRLYRWDDDGFVAHQDLAEAHGRAFASFEADGDRYLLVACLVGASFLLRWDGERFAEHTVLDWPGARELAVLRTDAALYLLRVNFILGTPADPTTALDSQLYRWDDGGFSLVQRFPTLGGTDVAALRDERGPLIAVSNALSEKVRFATDTVVYRFEEPHDGRI